MHLPYQEGFGQGACRLRRAGGWRTGGGPPPSPRRGPAILWPTLLYLFIPQNVPITCLWLWQTICQPPDTRPIINICSYKLPYFYSHILVRVAFELPNVDFLRNFSVQGLIIRSTGRTDNPPKCPKWNGLSVPSVERMIHSISGTDDPFHSDSFN